MKKFAFEDYREKLIGASPMLRERILKQADQDKSISFPDFVRLCELANAETA